jgi:hypothetical protein
MKTTHLEDRHRDETKFSTEDWISTEDEEEFNLVFSAERRSSASSFASEFQDL